MAAEAMKVIADAGDPLLGRMLIYDALSADVRVIGVKRLKSCSVCRTVT